jgi:hypothetical protein
MPETEPTRIKVYSLYCRNRKAPCGVIQIELNKGLISIFLDKWILNRLFIGCMLAWRFIKYKQFAIEVHTMQEKTMQEIADWHGGKGLK